MKSPLTSLTVPRGGMTSGDAISECIKEQGDYLEKLF